jgi:ketosteroid isomerase-like protein
MTTHSEHKAEHTPAHHYRMLAVMTLISFVSMYVLMYAMVNVSANVYMNFNQVYMAALMAAAMVIIELAIMKGMYPSVRRNAVLLLSAVVALIVSWTFIRRQVLISDSQFLRSMIPHHAGAILMCDEVSISDADIRDLCEGIVTSQQVEIEQMKLKLRGATSRVAQDSTAVVALIERYHGALAEGDTATALSLIAEGAMVLESGDIETREQYRAEHLAADVQYARTVSSRREALGVKVRGNLAWAVSSSRAKGAFRGRPVDSQGAELMVLTREREGWKIRAIHWSSHPMTGSR